MRVCVCVQCRVAVGPAVRRRCCEEAGPVAEADNCLVIIQSPVSAAAHAAWVVRGSEMELEPADHQHAKNIMVSREEALQVFFF